MSSPLAVDAASTQDEAVATSLVIINGFLVFFMQVGFLALETGSGRAKNVRNILLKNLLDVMLAALVWWGVGFAFAYGKSAAGVIGTSNFFYEGENLMDKAVRPWFFSWTFCIAACTIISGCLAERTALVAYPVATVLIAALVHPLLVHWLWNPQGWMNNIHQCGVLDFAGGMVVHMLGGLFGLVGAYMCGPRLGRFELLSHDDDDDGYDNDYEEYVEGGYQMEGQQQLAAAGGDGGDGGSSSSDGVECESADPGRCLRGSRDSSRVDSNTAVNLGNNNAVSEADMVDSASELTGSNSPSNSGTAAAAVAAAAVAAAAAAAAAAGAGAAARAADEAAGSLGSKEHQHQQHGGAPGSPLRLSSGAAAAAAADGSGVQQAGAVEMGRLQQQHQQQQQSHVAALPPVGAAAHHGSTDGQPTAGSSAQQQQQQQQQPAAPGVVQANSSSSSSKGGFSWLQWRPWQQHQQQQRRRRRKRRPRGLVHHADDPHSTSAATCGSGICKFVPKAMPGHDMAFVTLGCFMLWFGWFGFNNGSVYMYINGNPTPEPGALAGAVSAEVVQRTSMNTALGGAAAGLTSLLCAAIFWGTYDLRICCNGVLSGLVIVTCMCGFVDPWAAVVCSAIAGAMYAGASWALLRIGIDDPLDSSAVHFGSGMLGSIMVAFVANPKHVYALTGTPCGGIFYGSSGWVQLGLQLMGIAVVIVFAGGVAWVMFWCLNKKGWLRVDQMTELAGIDLLEHGGPAYPEFSASWGSGGNTAAAATVAGGRRIMG